MTAGNQEKLSFLKFSVCRHSLVNFCSTYLDVYVFAIATAGQGEADLG